LVPHCHALHRQHYLHGVKEGVCDRVVEALEGARSVREAKESLQVDWSLVDAEANEGVLVMGCEVRHRC
jgi:hypothetical protein